MHNQGVSDFLKRAYKLGKVKKAEEAFKEFDPKEEIHKGDVEFFLNEEIEKYSYYSVGDIVFVERYNYSDGSVGTNHLFVIIEQNNLAVPIESFGMLISSKIEKIIYKQNKLLQKDDKNNLKKDSIVKTDAIYIIKNEDILFKIGQVDLDKIEDYKKCYFEE